MGSHAEAVGAQPLLDVSASERGQLTDLQRLIEYHRASCQTIRQRGSRREGAYAPAGRNPTGWAVAVMRK